MPEDRRNRGLAVHIGADVLASPRHRDWPSTRSARDTVARMTRLCAAVGIPRQEQLLGTEATRDRVRGAITRAAAGLSPGGLLVLTFSGHSDRGEPDNHGQRDTGWCLHDDTLAFGELADALSVAAPSARVIVVAATCYAAALAQHPRWPTTLVLLAACDDYQTILSGPTCSFIIRLERLVCPRGQSNPRCTNYTWLEAELQKDTPDAERPQVWTTHAAAWKHRPFGLHAGRRTNGEPHYYEGDSMENEPVPTQIVSDPHGQHNEIVIDDMDPEADLAQKVSDPHGQHNEIVIED